MHTIYRMVLFITYFGILIHRHGVRGEGTGGDSRSGVGYYSGNRSSCTTYECRRADVIAVGIIIGSILGAMLLIYGTCCCYRSCKSRPLQKNSIGINVANSKQIDQKVFEVCAFRSGIWSSRYFQYGKWHEPHRFLLSFDSQSMRVAGSGSDDIGAFTIDGTYSIQTRRLYLTKKYQPDTGDRSKTLGHQVIIQLVWNAQHNQFEGTWYVQTGAYHSENKFQLKFDGQHLLTIYEEV